MPCTLPKTKGFSCPNIFPFDLLSSLCFTENTVGLKITFQKLGKNAQML